MWSLGRLARRLRRGWRGAALVAVCGATAGLAVFAAGRAGQWRQQQPLGYREQRFLEFASVQHDGQIYMTPRDFLASIVDREPLPVRKRREITADEVAAFSKATPSVKQGTSSMLRSLRINGIISYTEHLFLLAMIRKPPAGFRIAFDLLDRNQNHEISKSEFLIIEKIFSERCSIKEYHTRYANDQLCVQREGVPTTIISHFFGTDGRGVLKYNEFRMFMENLQREIAEVEFIQFSMGADHISEEDFARILLRYSYSDPQDYEVFFHRLVKSDKQKRGIGFEEFLSFCRFLKNIDNFKVAMDMMHIFNYRVSVETFNRAIKVCDGDAVSKHLVRTFIRLFELDKGASSHYHQFLDIVNDRLRRRFKTKTGNKMINDFLSCVKEEVRWQKKGY